MRTSSPLRLRGAVVVVLFLGASVAGAGEIVYDNTLTPTQGTYTPELEQGFWPFSVFADYELMGDVVILAGTERTVTQFLFMASSSQSTTVDSITLYLFSVDEGLPDTMLWKSDPSDTVDVAIDGITEVWFDVPNVVVGDSLAWAVSAASHVAGLATFGPPTVGSSMTWDDWDYYVDRDSGDLVWRPLDFWGDPIADFGARVIAIPEPATAAVLLLGGLPALLAWKRRPGYA